MTTRLLVGKDCPAERVGRHVEAEVEFMDCITGWPSFARDIKLNGDILLQLTIDLRYQRKRVSEVFTTAIQCWCKQNRDDAGLADLCIKLDNAKFGDAADALREKFMLKPTKRNLAIGPASYGDVSHHMIVNISSLASNTTLTPTLKRYVRTVKGLMQKDLAQFVTEDTSNQTIIGKFYQIFIDRPENYPNLINTLVDDNQISAAWILLGFYRRRKRQPSDQT